MRIIVLALMMLIISMPAQACKCAAPSIELGKKSVKEADFIIDGIIETVSIGLGNIGPIIKIKILKIHKGQDIQIGDIITVSYNDNTAACGHYFEPKMQVTLGLYDTKDIPHDEHNLKGYGYRLMMSCDQYQIENFIKMEGK